uniref:Uncharacterized protein n=1 Tax=Catharus ustulatus TaxID=91951 RepID=A0A8C3Y0U7_CATUS
MQIFPSGKVVDPTAPPRLGLLLSSFWKPLVLKLLLICAYFWVLIGAFKGFLCILYLGKANPKEPPQKTHSGCLFLIPQSFIFFLSLHWHFIFC